MHEEGFQIEIEAGVGLVTLDRPEKLNALRLSQLVAIGRICRALAVDEAVRCVVFTGAGRAFSSGTDLTDETDTKQAGPSLFMGTELDFITPLLEIGKPTIAAVNGIAVGAGFGIALACDIRLCGERGGFWANFQKLGMPATDGLPYLLPRAIGVSRSLELLYTADRIDAGEALRLGLVSHVFADDALMTEAIHLARRIAAASSVATRMTRRAVLAGLHCSWRDAVAHQELASLTNLVLAPHDVAAAIAAWRNGRKSVDPASTALPGSSTHIPQEESE